MTQYMPFSQSPPLSLSPLVSNASAFYCGSDKLFEKLNSDFTIKEKIEISVIRYDWNYFLEMDLSQIYLPEVVKPLQYVTKEMYNKCISKDQKAKSKKLSWVLKNQNEEFCADFREKYKSNAFKSVREAELYAASIYSKYCELYQSAKATVQSINGVKTHIKKRTYDCNEDSNKSEGVEMDEHVQECSDVFKENTNPVHEQADKFCDFKRKCLEKLNANLDELKKVVDSSSSSEINNQLRESNVSMTLNTEVFGDNYPSSNCNSCSDCENTKPVVLNVFKSVIQIIVDKDALS